MSEFVQPASFPSKCPECGSELRFCLNAYRHFDVRRSADGLMVLVPNRDGDHDEGQGKLSCVSCDWSAEDVDADVEGVRRESRSGVKVVASAREIDAAGAWEAFCKMRGIDLYARNEGLMSDAEEFEFTIEEAVRLHLVRVDR